MSKTTVTGFILCLVLMAVLFFVAGFLTGIRSSWHASGGAHPDPMTQPASPPAPVAHIPPAPPVAEVSPAQVPSVVSQDLKTLLRPFQNAAPLPKMDRARAAQPRIGPSSRAYTLRVGIYTHMNEARKALSVIEKVGYSGRLQKVKSQGQVLYHISAGNFHQQGAAKKALKKLQTQGFKYATITPLQGGTS